MLEKCKREFQAYQEFYKTWMQNYMTRGKTL